MNNFRRFRKATCANVLNMKQIIYSVALVIVLFGIYPCTARAQFGPQQILTSNAEGAYDVKTADIDGDGDLDVYAASSEDDTVSWFENEGNGNFGEQIVISSNAEGVAAVHSGDMDGDGDIDVLSASSQDNRLVWYENIDNGSSFVEHVITTSAFGASGIQAADLDGDGDMDVAYESSGNGQLGWYKNYGFGIFVFQSPFAVIAGDGAMITSDFDGDEYMDILIPYGGSIKWIESIDGVEFSITTIITDAPGTVWDVGTADFDGDGDNDVLASILLYDKIVWYENLGNSTYSDYNSISQYSVGQCLSVAAADIDNDGDIDIAAASSLSWESDKIKWFENLGDGTFLSEQIISTDVDLPWSVHAADLDGDGDLELLSASRFDNKIAWYENKIGDGCMDSTACNFDPQAYNDDSSCCFGICGCTDPTSTAFNALAECEDESCTYRLNGAVFYDANINGLWDETEIGLPMQEVMIQPMGWTTFTNDEGHFSFIGPGLGEYSAELIPDNIFPYPTTLNPLDFEVIWNTPSSEIEFGVNIANPVYGINVELYPWNFGYPCDSWEIHNIIVQNNCNVILNGIVELEMDALFQDYMEITPIDSVVGNIIYMSYENLLPGQSLNYQISMLTPTVDFIGEGLTSTVNALGYFEDMQVAVGYDVHQLDIACAYDPNDKQVFPNGHLEEHLILNETELEYLIRFQNTGNAPATNVLVTDTIDENLNLETFALVANSHSVQTTIKPDERVIQFFFENIMLPDSTANEPESHGLISYKITPYPDLEPGTVLNNTGNIYFDNNPPIITNTTWNTIHECGGEAGYTVLSETECDGIYVEISTNYPWLETISWSSDDVELSSSETLNLSFTELGSHEYTLLASNPLCEESVTIIHEVDELPQLPPCFADFNCDGHRNIIDLLDFLPEFGCLSDCEKDLDSDGIISVFDLSIFLGLVGEDCEE